jgi:hypothetical protein
VKWLADENFRNAILQGIPRPDSLSIGSVIQDLLLLGECAVEADWAAGVLYLPLR